MGGGFPNQGHFSNFQAQINKFFVEENKYSISKSNF